MTEEGNEIMSCLKSQEMRRLAPELDPLRIGTGWKPEDLSKPQVIIAVSYTHLPVLSEAGTHSHVLVL